MSETVAAFPYCPICRREDFKGQKMVAIETARLGTLDNAYYFDQICPTCRANLVGKGEAVRYIVQAGQQEEIKSIVNELLSALR